MAYKNISDLFAIYNALKQKESKPTKMFTRWDRLKHLMSEMEPLKVSLEQPEGVEQDESGDESDDSHLTQDGPLTQDDSLVQDGSEQVDDVEDPIEEQQEFEERVPPLIRLDLDAFRGLQTESQMKYIKSNPEYAGNPSLFHFLAHKDPLPTMFKYFKDKGLSDYAIAGIIGNFMAESGLNPQAVNEGERKANYKGFGRGLAQWSNERVDNFRQLVGKEIEESTLLDQLDFVWFELQQRSNLLNQLQNATNATDAADLIYRGYENGSLDNLATPEQMNNTYKKAWRNLGIPREYDYNTETLIRQKRANKVLDDYYARPFLSAGYN